MKETGFFLAFLSSLWLLGLILYWLFMPVKFEREGILERYRLYQATPGIANKAMQAIFVLLNAHVLCPFKGIAVAFSLIAVFVLFFR